MDDDGLWVRPRGRAWGNEAQRAVLHAIAEDLEAHHHQRWRPSRHRPTATLSSSPSPATTTPATRCSARPRRSPSTTSVSSASTWPAAHRERAARRRDPRLLRSTATYRTRRPPASPTAGTPTTKTARSPKTRTASCAGCSTSTSRCRRCAPRRRAWRSMPRPGCCSRRSSASRRARALRRAGADGRPGAACDRERTTGAGRPGPVQGAVAEAMAEGVMDVATVDVIAAGSEVPGIEEDRRHVTDLMRGQWGGAGTSWSSGSRRGA